MVLINNARAYYNIKQVTIITILRIFKYFDVP